MVANKAVIFKKAPSSLPVEGEHLAIEQQDFDRDQSPPQGGLTVRVNYLSFDPYMRGRLREGGKSYVPAFELNKPITNRGIATVIKSDNDKFKPDDEIVVESLSFAEYAALDKNLVDRACSKLENPHGIDPRIFLGALGMPGITAYSSFYEIGKPQKSETILISAASGAVGQVVGQLAKHEGLKVIASVGDDKKLDFVTKELGFDCGFNYKKEKPADALKRLAPDGIDIYYENVRFMSRGLRHRTDILQVGGEHLEAALNAMNNFGRISKSCTITLMRTVCLTTNTVACGMISQYNLPPNELYGVKSLMMVVGKRITIRGFIQADKDFGPKYRDEHRERVAKWIAEGTFKPKTDTTEGIDNAIKGFLGIYSGDNFGKALLSVAPLSQ